MTQSSGKTTFPEDFFYCAKRLHHDYLLLLPKLIRRFGRVVDCTGLENRQTETSQGSESLSLRMTQGKQNASLAQLEEQLTFNEQVVGSSPTCGTILLQ